MIHRCQTLSCFFSRPIGSTQRAGAVNVQSNARSHIFCATTFPVYFPVVSMAPGSIIPVASCASNPATYLRLPTTTSLPLNRVHWVKHTTPLTNVPGIKTAENSNNVPISNGFAPVNHKDQVRCLNALNPN